MINKYSIQEHCKSFYYTGLVRKMLKDNSICEILSKAGELGRMEAFDAFKKYCQ